MAKLIALVLAFTAVVAFATAHTTIVTTTIEDHNPISSQRQCSQQLQGHRLNQCHMYLQQGQSPYENSQQQGQQQTIQQCCQQLQNVDQQCQCEAVKQVFRDVIQQQQGQQQFGAGQQTRQLKQKAQMLPNLCNLQSRQCQIGSIMTTTTTVTDDSNPSYWPSGSQQCSQSEIQRPVNQCQRYVEQQMWSPILMSISRKGQQQDQSRQQCCNQLQNVKRECQCEAIKEVAREMMQQQQGSRRQGGQQDETQMIRSVIQNLPNECRLEVQQCSIPYGMF